MFVETHSRSAIKAVSWRLTGTLATGLIVYLLTASWGAALTIGIVEFVSKFALFFVHERAWDKIKYGRQQKKPVVIWLTGLSGAGKSTIAEHLVKKLVQMGHKVEHLDGDSIRNLFPSTGFSNADRDQHIRRVGFLASRLEKHGIDVVASLISPQQESRQFVRGLCTNFIEVYVSTSLEECEKRDPKGLYAKARRGEIFNFTGISSLYEKPENPEITIDTINITAEQAAEKILKTLTR